MGSDFYEFGSTFWLSLGTLIFGFGGACLAYGLRSKCSSIKLCYGLIDVTRDIDAEVELEQTVEQSPITPTLEQPPAVHKVTPPVSRNRSLLASEIKELIQKELSNNNV
jgi:hypothetical protein